MVDLSNYSCDKCKREFSRYCKYCLHTSSEIPTKFKPKKKIGCQTPEFRLKTGEKFRQVITNLCGKLVNQSEEIIKMIYESGFKKPTLVIKLFDDESVVVYINEEFDELNYIELNYIGGEKQDE